MVSLPVKLWFVLVLIIGAASVFVGWPPPPPPAEVPAPQVLRRLELRLSDSLDETHPVVGGERYRRFECKEVPR